MRPLKTSRTLVTQNITLSTADCFVSKFSFLFKLSEMEITVSMAS